MSGPGSISLARNNCYSDPKTPLVERVEVEEREEMTVLVEVPDTSIDRAQAAADIEQRLKEVIGVRVTVKPMDRGGTDSHTGTSQTSKIKRLLDRRR